MITLLFCVQLYLCGLPAKKLDKLRRLVNQAGGLRFNQPSDDLTHVVMGEPDKDLISSLARATHRSEPPGSAGPLVRWSAGPLVRWSTGPLVHWSTGPLVHWSTGPLAAPWLRAESRPVGSRQARTQGPDPESSAPPPGPTW